MIHQFKEEDSSSSFFWLFKKTALWYNQNMISTAENWKRINEAVALEAERKADAVSLGKIAWLRVLKNGPN